MTVLARVIFSYKSYPFTWRFLFENAATICWYFEELSTLQQTEKRGNKIWKAQCYMDIEQSGSHIWLARLLAILVRFFAWTRLKVGFLYYNFPEKINRLFYLKIYEHDAFDSIQFKGLVTLELFPLTKHVLSCILYEKL